MSVDYAIGLFAGSGELNAPTADGTSGQVLQTDGSGQLSFVDAVGGVSGSGATGTVQLSDGSGGLTSVATFVFTGAKLGIGTDSPQISYGNGLEFRGSNGGIRLSTTNAGGWAYMEFRNSAEAIPYIVGFRGTSNDYRIIAGASLGLTTGMVMSSTGKVGFGKASPNTQIDSAGPVTVGVYTFAAVPAASANNGAIIRISDRSQKQAYSDGTDWRFTGTDAIIS